MAARVPETAVAIISREPYLAWARAATLFFPLPPAVPGAHPSAVIAPDAQVDVPDVGVLGELDSAMKFTLKDYQDEAVIDVLRHLRKARKRWHEDTDPHAFSLTAPTGAGKTVMAAAVFEALFHGDDRYEFDRDPGAVVIWFSDDPSLNEQTRFRLMESADRIQHTDLVVVENW